MLGIGSDSQTNVGYFTGNGMYGGKIILRGDRLPDLPEQISAREATADDIKEIRTYVEEYCSYFGAEIGDIMKNKFFVITPNTANPYKQLYTSV